MSSMEANFNRSFLKWAIPDLFFFILLLFSKNDHDKILPMIGFDPLTSSIESNYSANWATTTGQDGSIFACEEDL